MTMKLLVCLIAVCIPNGNALLHGEFRIPLPFTAEQYRIGHLWSTAEWSICNTGGGEGVEIITNQPYDDKNMYMGKGQYTHKIHHLASRVPSVVRKLAPKGSLELHEKSWNAFPYVKTVLSNPDYMKDGFHVTTNTTVVENDDCRQDSISSGTLIIDIGNDPVDQRDYKEDEDPTKCRSEKLNLGPLTKDWNLKEITEPRLCVYRSMEVKFKWFGLQTTVESRIAKFATRFYRDMYRKMFCWADNWAELTMPEIREIEKFTKEELNKIRRVGPVVGMKEQ